MIRDDDAWDVLVATEADDGSKRTAWYRAGSLLPAALDRRNGRPGDAWVTGEEPS